MKRRKNSVNRVLRGGSFDFGSKILRVACGGGLLSNYRRRDGGFRFVMRGKVK